MAGQLNKPVEIIENGQPTGRYREGMTGNVIPAAIANQISGRMDYAKANNIAPSSLTRNELLGGASNRIPQVPYSAPTPSLLGNNSYAAGGLTPNNLSNLDPFNQDVYGLSQGNPYALNLGAIDPYMQQFVDGQYMDRFQPNYGEVPGGLSWTQIMSNYQKGLMDYLNG